MNPTVDNDLQKAIDDITKNTNTDPVFSDPVAAPAPIAESDNNPIASPASPISDFKPAAAPRPITRPVMPTPAPTPAAMPMPPVAAPSATVEAPLPPAPTPTQVSSTTVADVITENATPAGNMGPAEVPSDIKSVKEAALRDLAPILGKMDMDASKKFNLYKDIREELHDNSVIGDAYTAAKDIADETERGDALLYLIESIDNM